MSTPHSGQGGVGGDGGRGATYMWSAGRAGLCGGSEASLFSVNRVLWEEQIHPLKDRHLEKDQNREKKSLKTF